MRRILIVRADYYNNGSIIPLGITYDNGEMEFVQTVLQYKRSGGEKGNEIHMFCCTTNRGEICLSFDSLKWEMGNKMDLH